jgi:hypothetical protein
MPKSPFEVAKVSDTRTKPKLPDTSAEDAAASSGVLDTPKIEATAEVARPANSKVIGKYLNSSIVIQSPGEDPNTDQIFITAGHGAALKNITAKDPATGEDIPYVGNHFNSDASQIILGTSMNLASAEIAEGSVPDPGDQANIYIGTDYLTLDGTKSIKLITGRKATIAPGASDKLSYGGVEIIAGNDDSEGSLQPLVKGDNLKAALIDLMKQVQWLADTVHYFAQVQNLFNMELKGHNHGDLLSPHLGYPYMKNIQANTKVKEAGNLACQHVTEYTLPDLEERRKDLDAWKALYLDSTETNDCILSSLNKVN